MTRRRTPRPLRKPRRSAPAPPPPPPPGPQPVGPDAQAYLAAWIELARERPGRHPEHRRVAAVAGLDSVDASAARDELLAAGWLMRRRGSPPWIPLQTAAWLCASDLIAIAAAAAHDEDTPGPIRLAALHALASLARCGCPLRRSSIHRLNG